MGIENVWAFALAGIILNLTPGQDTVYIVGRSIAHGKRSGILSALGVSSGCILHVLLASFGLSSVLMSSAWVFQIVKFLGAGYLLYLGIRMILERSDLSFDCAQSGNNLQMFWRGFLTNALNPKVAIFFLSFLPQFVSPSAQNPGLSMIALGVIFLLTGTLWCLTLAYIGARARTMFESQRNMRVFRFIAGGSFIGLGLQLASAKTND